MKKAIGYYPLAILCVGLSQHASAFGLGDADVTTQLGDKLHANVAILGDASQLTTSCIHAKVENDEHTLLMTGQTSVNMNGDGGSTINISTRNAINEPVIYLDLTVECAGLVYQRNYPLLLDAPLQDFHATQPDLSPVLSQAAPLVIDKNLKIDTKQTQFIKPTAHHLANAHRFTSEHTKPHQPETPVLSIGDESPATVIITQPTITANPSAILTQPELVASNALKLPQATSSPPTLNQQRIPHLINQAQHEQQQISQLQSTLKHVQTAQQSTSHLNAILLALVGLESIILLIVIRDRKKARQTALWPTPSTTTTTTQNVTTITTGSETPGTPRVSSAPDGQLSPILSNENIEATPAPSYQDMDFFSHEIIEVEEISDITQEAEYWMSVNNTDKAIEVLEFQINSNNRSNIESPAPWLYLLDLYKAAGRKNSYQELQERFAIYFNARTLDFDTEPTSVAWHHIEDYPHIIRNISGLWATDNAISYLKSLLLADPGRQRIGFDLPVYQDILMLINLAREINKTTPSDDNPQRSTNKTFPGDELDLDIQHLHEAFRIIEEY